MFVNNPKTLYDAWPAFYQFVDFLVRMINEDKVKVTRTGEIGGMYRPACVDIWLSESKNIKEESKINFGYEPYRGLFAGTLKGVMTNVEWAKRDNPVMLDIYANRMKEKGQFSKLPKKDIKKKLQDLMDKKEDVYLTPQQTVEWGLADAIFEGDWQRLRK